jgi:uncharacterized protein YdaU (DUF1376 family)
MLQIKTERQLLYQILDSFFSDDGEPIVHERVPNILEMYKQYQEEKQKDVGCSDCERTMRDMRWRGKIKRKFYGRE